MQPDASPPGVNIGSVVQALRGNSSRTLLDVRNGSRWRFKFTRFPTRNYLQWEGSLEERHLTAIEDSLLKNDTLQSFAFFAGHEFGFPNHLALHETIRDTFERILQWNMCLVEISIRCVRSVNLGPKVTKAIERNKRAWTVAKHLVNRSSADAWQNLGDIVLRRMVLCFFLANGCQEPPRQMLHIAGGLPVWRHVSRDVL